MKLGIYLQNYQRKFLMKNKKITIATNERSNMIAFLKGNYHLTTDHYYTHFGEHHSSNFDVFLQFDGSNPYALNSNVKTFGMDRYTKKEQVLILDKLGIIHPPSLISETVDRHEDFYIFSLSDKPNTKYVVKSNDGARGVGTFLISKDQFYIFLEDSDESEDVLSSEDFCKKYKAAGAYNNDGEYSFAKSSIKDRKFVVQELEDIVSEYRVIAGYGNSNPIVYERKIDRKVSWMANSSIQGEGVHIENIGNEMYVAASLLIKKLFDEFETPFICFDMYENSKGEIGILEFQMQMGYRYINKDRLVNVIREGVYNLLKKKKVI